MTDRDLAIARAALEAAAGLMDDELYSGFAELILTLDPAAIVAGVGEDAEVDVLRARVAELEGKYAALKETLDPNSIGFSMAVMIAEAEEKADSLRARVATLEQDADRLAALVWPECVVDGIGAIDIHEEAAINASAFGRDEPNKDDYLAAFRTAIDAAMREGKG